MQRSRITVALALILLLPAALACTPFGAAPTCGISQVGASAANGGDLHKYDFVLVAASGPAACAGVTNAHVLARYDVGTNQGVEQSDYQGASLKAQWSCSSDPWIYPAGQTPQCVRISSDLNGDTSHVDPGYLRYYDNAVLPLSAGVLTEIDRKALNGQLQNAIQQLQATAPASTPTPKPIKNTSVASPDLDCPNGRHAPQNSDGWPDLDLCSGGSAVLTLDWLLTAHGMPAAQGLPPGEVTPRILSEVANVEQANGVTSSGIVDEAAWQSVIITVQLGSQGNAVTGLQYALNLLGESVPTDGNFGPQVDAAVRDYQTRQNLAVDGVVGPQTWQSLISSE